MNPIIKEQDDAIRAMKDELNRAKKTQSKLETENKSKQKVLAHIDKQLNATHLEIDQCVIKSETQRKRQIIVGKDIEPLVDDSSAFVTTITELQHNLAMLSESNHPKRIHSETVRVQTELDEIRPKFVQLQKTSSKTGAEDKTLNDSYVTTEKLYEQSFLLSEQHLAKEKEQFNTEENKYKLSVASINRAKAELDKMKNKIGNKKTPC